VLIDGAVYFERDKDLADRPQRDAEKNGLVEKQKQRRPAPARRPS
jgi:hypothetical protein